MAGKNLQNFIKKGLDFMSKKKKGRIDNWNRLNDFCGCEIRNFINEKNHDYPEIHFSNGKIVKVYEEGSYSDYWENSFSWNKNNHNMVSRVIVDENQKKQTITIYFVDIDGKTILKCFHEFFNESGWDYGCYISYFWKEKGEDVEQYFYI